MWGPIVMERKGRESIGCPDVKYTKEMSQLDAVLTGVPLALNFDLEFSRSNCILGMRSPIVMEWKGQDRMPWYETQQLCDFEAERILLGTGRGDLRCRPHFRQLI